ncbi:MAG: DNA internalization-related competence protein ComEC/Rec2 [Gammaproteobacteria bacterium]
MILNVVFFAGGVLLVQQLPELPGVGVFWGAAAAAVLLAYGRYRLPAFFLFGCLWTAYLATERLSHRLPVALEGRDLTLVGTVAGLPEKDSRRVLFDFSVEDGGDRLNRLPQLVRLSWYDPSVPIRPGQKWRFSVRLKRPHGTLNPGGFDYEGWLFVRGVDAVGYVRKRPPPELVDRFPSGLDLSSVRFEIAERQDVLLGASPRRGLIKALTIGDRHDVDRRHWEVFRKTGTVHLMAISGLHIGMIAGAVFFLVLKLWTRTGCSGLPPPGAAAVCSMTVAALYAGLAGFSVPTQRALVMLAAASVGILVQRNVRPLNTLVLAMLAVLLADPFALLSSGFWLSFLAVLFIIFVLAGRLKKTGFWKGALKIQLATSLGLAPMVLYFFQQVSLISPLANFIAVPVISFWVVPFSLAGVFALPASTSAANVLFQAADGGLKMLLTVLDWLADLPFSAVVLEQPPLWAMLLATAGCFLLLAPRGVPARWLGAVFFLPMLFNPVEKIASGAVKMTMLDVGQGLSAVVRTRNHVLVFDSGPGFGEGFDMGVAAVLPFLRSQGVRKVDALLISHGDNDHAGGAHSLLKGIEIEKIYTSAPGLFGGYPNERCRAGQQWIWDQVVFRMLSPPDQEFEGENDNSCVLKVESDYGSLLLTGDIESTAESRLAETFARGLNAEILTAPHHGSKTSSTAFFLRQVDPKIILISAGYRNRFGFPHAEVLERFRRANATWFSTADQGAMTVYLDGRKLSMDGYRRSEGKFWNSIP